MFVTMNNDQIQNLADTIASAINSPAGREIEKLRESIDSLSSRLQRLEDASHSPASDHNKQLAHPSLDRFAVAEAIADSIFGPETKEKACTFEPDRPCDHCSMCSSRGF